MDVRIKVAVFEMFILRLVGLDAWSGCLAPVRDFSMDASQDDTSRVLTDAEFNTANKMLGDLSAVKLMKLLYFACLEDAIASPDEAMKDGKMPPLFSLFDTFYPYPKGPVEEEVYYNKTTMSLFSWLCHDAASGRYYIDRTRLESFRPLRFEAYTYIGSVNRAVRQLRGRQTLVQWIGMGQEGEHELVELSHRLPLWRPCCRESKSISESLKGSYEGESNLKREFEAYLKEQGSGRPEYLY